MAVGVEVVSEAVADEAVEAVGVGVGSVVGVCGACGGVEDADGLGGGTTAGVLAGMVSIVMSPSAVFWPAVTVTIVASASVVAPPHQWCDGVGSPGG